MHFTSPRGLLAHGIRIKLYYKITAALGIPGGYYGEQPNLDLINSVVRIADSAHLRISTHWERELSDQTQSQELQYEVCLKAILYSLWDQLKMKPTGPHGAYKSHGIDAITIRGQLDPTRIFSESISTVGMYVLLATLD
jgi:hypothetical protein